MPTSMEPFVGQISEMFYLLQQGLKFHILRLSSLKKPHSHQTRTVVRSLQGYDRMLEIWSEDLSFCLISFLKNRFLFFQKKQVFVYSLKVVLKTVLHILLSYSFVLRMGTNKFRSVHRLLVQERF